MRPLFVRCNSDRNANGGGIGGSMRVLRVTVIGVVLLITTLPGTLSGGQRTQPIDPMAPQVPTTPPHTGVPDFGPPASPKMEEQQARARSTERQKKLVADTDKLLALATELKTDVDKTNKDILSMDVIKKADEIEKLAHSVKERMKG
jgi:hypothetical protein